MLGRRGQAEPNSDTGLAPLPAARDRRLPVFPLAIVIDCRIDITTRWYMIGTAIIFLQCSGFCRSTSAPQRSAARPARGAACPGYPRKESIMKPEADSGGLPPPEIEPNHAPCSHVGRTGGSVLLALTDADYPTEALEQATLLAHSLEGSLHVLRVLLELQPFTPSWPDLDIVEATRRIQRCLAATRRTKSWCDRTLWEPLSARQLRIRVG